jgi:hypothetical protein
MALRDAVHDEGYNPDCAFRKPAVGEREKIV